eukprot:GDKJ01009661.1.p1 GENE.GDKJ01009661.1~~GDKJ01009661.1.p1  ORF type:complete len:716 (+),score=148.80 GDKJ01009661.1:103-2148(+)
MNNSLSRSGSSGAIPERLKLFLKSDRAIRHGLGRTVLHLAAVLGQAEIIKVMLRDTPSKSTCFDAAGITPLHLAVAADSPDAVTALVICGAQKDAKTFLLGESPLHFAVNSNLADMCVLLSTLGCDVNSRNSKSETPLIRAAKIGAHDSLRTLIEMKKKRQAPAESQLLDGVVSSSNSIGGISINLIGASPRRSTVTRQVESDQVAKTAEDSTSIAQLNTKDVNGDTAIHHAVRKSDVDAVRLLCRGGADVLLKNNADDTPITIAIDKANTKILKMLISASNLELNDLPTDNKGFNVLQRAVIRGEVSVLTTLLGMGATNTIRHQSLGLYELAVLFGHDHLAKGLCKRPLNTQLGIKGHLFEWKTANQTLGSSPKSSERDIITLKFDIHPAIASISPKLTNAILHVVNITNYLANHVRSLDSLTLKEESHLIDHLVTHWHEMISHPHIAPHSSTLLSTSIHNHVRQLSAESRTSNSPEKKTHRSSSNAPNSIMEQKMIPVDQTVSAPSSSAVNKGFCVSSLPSSSISSLCELSIKHTITRSTFFIPEHLDNPPPLRVPSALLPHIPQQDVGKAIDSLDIPDQKNKKEDEKSKDEKQIRQVWSVDPKTLVEFISCPFSSSSVLPKQPPIDAPPIPGGSLNQFHIPKSPSGVLREGIYACRLLGANIGGSTWGFVSLFEIKSL